MGKTDRIGLPRGAELLTEHVFDPLSDIAGTIAAAGISGDQLQAPKATFRLNFNVPHISARFFHANPGGLFYIPFCLPSLQEWFTLEPAALPHTPVPTLKEVIFSFDQRAEAAHIYDRWHGLTMGPNTTPDSSFVSNPEEGFLNYGRAAGVDVKLSIYEKVQYFFGGVLWPDHFVEGEVFSMTVGAPQLANTVLRENPASSGPINVPINPKKGYVVGINADGLYDAAGDEHLALVSVQIGLVFEMTMVMRDNAVAYATYAQNMPVVHLGARTGEAITITRPAAGDVVQADTAAGLSTNMEKLDSRLRHKLLGGYGEFSSAHPAQHLVEDAAYEVIAVPMFGNAALGEILARPSWLSLRGTGTGEGNYIDRALIPITSPMTIHHVIATCNYTSATKDDGSVDGGPTVPGGGILGDPHLLEVGVAVLGDGLVDDMKYAQIAHVVFFPRNNLYTVDAFDLLNPATHAPIGLGGATINPPFEQKLFTVPIVRNGTAGGNGSGYYDVNSGVRGIQGKPFYVGPAAAGGVSTRVRTNVGTNVGSVYPETRGGDAYLEVRMQITPNNGNVYEANTWMGRYREWDMFSGYGGCWVYIIGKKHMRM